MSADRIQQDHRRFRQILRGKIKQNLRKYITQGELLGRQGKDVVSIPLPQIDTPRFRFGQRDQGGVGQGDGQPGDPVGQGQPQPGQGQAGSDPGEHAMEVDVTLDELAEMLGEELQLPRIQPRGKKEIVTRHLKYTGIHNVGPEGLKHFRRTYREALKRQIMSGTYDPKRPVVVPTRQDKRYRSWREVVTPETNAVILYMMDVSGSMGDEQKEIVRMESFWIDTWLRSQYQGLQVRYIVHDAVAKEVDRHTFFHTRESGGTMISSAYKLCEKMIRDDYAPTEWNIYPFHFSDGDNWSGDDTRQCLELLRKSLLPSCNMFCYGQVESPYGSGQFLRDLEEAFPDEEKLITSDIKGKEGIYESIREFLGKGH
jgi:hypothetical protein